MNSSHIPLFVGIDKKIVDTILYRAPKEQYKKDIIIFKE
jgi:hypothetical protein